VTGNVFDRGPDTEDGRRTVVLRIGSVGPCKRRAYEAQLKARFGAEHVLLERRDGVWTVTAVGMDASGEDEVRRFCVDCGMGSP